MSSTVQQATIGERITVAIVWAGLVTAGDYGLHALGWFHLSWGTFGTFGAVAYYFGGRAYS